ERVSKVLMPILLAIVVIAAIRTLTLDGAGSGIRFLFTPDWKTLASPTTWLEALTQNAWDTGAGWGLILTYAAYMHRRHGVVRSERVSKVLMPILLAIVVIAAIRTLTLDGAGSGIRFLFTPDWKTLASPTTWLEALTQNAWDTGAGWGLILTYAAYMHRRHGVV